MTLHWLASFCFSLRSESSSVWRGSSGSHDSYFSEAACSAHLQRSQRAALAPVGLLAVFGVDWRSGLFTGFLVALSSTAIVLKVLADRGETNQEPGQIGLGLLIFQDLAVIVMVLMIPMLSGSGGSFVGI